MSGDSIPLKVDLHGRVRNIRLHPQNALYSLYEAVVNSIHSTLDCTANEMGNITISILRANEQLTFDGKPGPVIGFEVTDHGVGFDERNFDSFSYSDCMTKAKYGGKGVGRFSWLKVFREVSVSSVFREGKTRWRREFSFSTDGIGPPTLVETSEPQTTTVTMKSPIERYRAALQHEPETTAISTIEHCLEYLMAERKPRIFLEDPRKQYSVELGTLFETLRSCIQRVNFEFMAQHSDLRIYSCGAERTRVMRSTFARTRAA